MSRRPGYETLAHTGLDTETRRETMAQRADGGIGRPRGAAPRAAAQRRGGEDQGDDGELTRLQMRTRLLELGAR